MGKLTVIRHSICSRTSEECQYADHLPGVTNSLRNRPPHTHTNCLQTTQISVTIKRGARAEGVRNITTDFKGGSCRKVFITSTQTVSRRILQQRSLLQNGRCLRSSMCRSQTHQVLGCPPLIERGVPSYLKPSGPAHRH